MFIESLGKGLAVLETFQPDTPTLTLSEIARRTGLSISSAQRITHTLTTLGYLEKDPAQKNYRIGPLVLTLAQSYMQSVDLQRASQAPMQDLASAVEETVNVSVRSGLEIVYLLRIPSRKKVVVPNLWIGSTLPIQLTSMGRAIIAFLPTQEQDDITKQLEFPYETNTRTVTKETFHQDLAEIRTNGYSINDRDLRSDLLSIAAPLFNHEGKAVAALGVAVSANQYSVQKLQDLVKQPLLSAASTISRSLGFQVRV